MSDLYGLISSYDEAEEFRKKKDYLRAVRLYRMCIVYYENGELYPYDRDAERKAFDARGKYDKCLSKLTDSAKLAMSLELKRYTDDSFTFGEWKEFLSEESKRIDLEVDASSSNKLGLFQKIPSKLK